MKKKLMTMFIALFAIISSPVFGESSDPCTGPNVRENSWLIEINSEDNSSREDILKTLDLLSVGGFKLKEIFSHGELSSKTLVVSFDPSYYLEEADGIQAKEETLGALKMVDGNVIHCNRIFRPIGVFR